MKNEYIYIILHIFFRKYQNHKGYPTKAHLDAIKKYGILDNYRFTFGPVRDLIETGGKNERQIRKTNI